MPFCCRTSRIVREAAAAVVGSDLIEGTVGLGLGYVLHQGVSELGFYSHDTGTIERGSTLHTFVPVIHIRCIS